MLNSSNQLEKRVKGGKPISHFQFAVTEEDMDWTADKPRLASHLARSDLGKMLAGSTAHVCRVRSSGATPGAPLTAASLLAAKLK